MGKAEAGALDGEQWEKQRPLCGSLRCPAQAFGLWELWMVSDGWTWAETVWKRGLGFMCAEEMTGGRSVRAGIMA